MWDPTPRVSDIAGLEGVPGTCVSVSHKYESDTNASVLETTLRTADVENVENYRIPIVVYLMLGMVALYHDNLALGRFQITILNTSD